jgi:succinyl-CoA synthetase beta subunit
MDIEEVAEKSPDAIKVHPIDMRIGFTSQDAEKIVDSLNLKGKLREQGMQ